MTKKEKKRKRIFILVRLTSIIVIVIVFFVVVSSNFNVYTSITYDVSKNRSVKAIHLVSKYVESEVETISVSSLSEALKYAETNPVTFTGTITGYGPDCDGCSGTLACPPRHNAKNGNIYFNDSDYGQIRIVAGDSLVPCGTIVKVSNLSGYDDFYAIVLDRGSAIRGTLFDLLFTSNSSASSMGRRTATYTIVRWGW